MVDYPKKTVAELQEILKSRGLSSTGKKADLVARLQAADEEAEVQGKHNRYALLILTTRKRSKFVIHAQTANSSDQQLKRQSQLLPL